MGRWAQRSRRGGGPGTRPPATISITGVTISASDQVQVNFDGDVDATQFTPNNFRIDVGAGLQGADSVTQDDNDTLFFTALGWDGFLAVDEPWQYIDSVPDVISPQNGTIS